MKNPYSNIPITIWLITAATLISRSGGMVLVFLPLYLSQKLGFGIIVTGQILSLYGLGAIVGSYAGGDLSDRIGFLKVQILCFFMVGLLYILLEFLNLKILIMIAMFFVGMLTAAIRPATASAIAKYCAEDVRVRAYAFNHQAANLGWTAGPAIGGMLASIDYLWLFRVDGMVNVLAAGVLWLFFRKREQVVPVQDKVLSQYQNLSPWRDKPFLVFLILSFFIGMCFMLVLNIYPIFLKNDYHLSEFEIGMIMAINGLLIILLQMPITEHLKKYNLLRAIGVGGALISLGYFVLPFYTGFYYAILSMIIVSVGEMVSIPFTNNFVAKIAPSAYKGKYLGLLNCIFAVALLLSPCFSSYIYTVFGPEVLWRCVGLVGVIIFIGFECLKMGSTHLWSPHCP